MPDQPEIYPMPMFPTLSVADVAASVDWYTNKMGFMSVFTLPAPDGGVAMAHLRWRKYADLLLVPDSGPLDIERPKGVGIALSFLVYTTPVDEMAANLATNGVEVGEGPVTRPWNVREIVVRDPDGFTLVFLEPVDITRNFEGVMGIAPDSSADRAQLTEDSPR